MKLKSGLGVEQEKVSNKERKLLYWYILLKITRVFKDAWNFRNSENYKLVILTTLVVLALKHEER